MRSSSTRDHAGFHGLLWVLRMVIAMQQSFTGGKNRRNVAERAAAAALTIIILLLAVCVVELAALALLIARPEAQETRGDTPKNTQGGAENNGESTEVHSPEPATALLAATSDYGQDYVDRLTFVGDSTTHGMKSQHYHVLSGGTGTKQVWTSSTGTLSLDLDINKKTIVYPETGAEMTIAEAAALKKPEYLVVTLGINYGVPYLDETKFKQCYRKLLEDLSAASPSTKIILQSIFPVASDNEIKAITNEKIDTANLWVADLALEYNLKYLDTNSVLKDSGGWLNPAYKADSLHLNREGFNAVLGYIRTHGYPKS